MSWPPPLLPGPARIQRGWLRAGLLSSLLFVAVGVGLVVLNPQAPVAPAYIVPSALITLLFFGDRERLHGIGDWVRAAGLFAALVFLAFSVTTYVWVLAGCPGITPGC
jgi:hypothetical protein